MGESQPIYALSMLSLTVSILYYSCCNYSAEVISSQTSPAPYTASSATSSVETKPPSNADLPVANAATAADVDLSAGSVGVCLSGWL